MTKILVADDDAVMRSLLTTLMELEGNEVVAVKRPSDIIPTVERETPALIILDYHLAGGDVMETLQELKEHEQLKEIPVLVASGMDRQTVSLNAGADGFILKPFSSALLLEKINAMLEVT